MELLKKLNLNVIFQYCAVLENIPKLLCCEAEMEAETHCTNRHLLYRMFCIMPKMTRNLSWERLQSIYITPLERKTRKCLRYTSLPVTLDRRRPTIRRCHPRVRFEPMHGKTQNLTTSRSSTKNKTVGDIRGVRTMNNHSYRLHNRDRPTLESKYRNPNNERTSPQRHPNGSTAHAEYFTQ